MKSRKRSMYCACAALLICMACAFGVSAQIVVENSDFTQGSLATTTNTLEGFTVASGLNRKLVVPISWEGSTFTIESMTYGGQDLTQGVASRPGRVSEIWYQDDPTVGTADLVVIFSEARAARFGVLSLQNAAEGLSVSSAIDNSLSIDLTTVESNSFVVGVYTENAGVSISSDFATTLYNGDSGSSIGDAGYQIEELPGEKTYTWTAANNGSALAVAAFAVAPPASTLAVDFGGDYRSDTQNAPAGNYALTLEMGDYDFGVIGDDRRGYRSLDSAFMTIVPVAGTGTPGESKVFFAGYQIANFDSIADPGIGLYRYNGSSDCLQMTSAAGTSDMGMLSAPHVKKMDFISGLNDGFFVLSFENTVDSVRFSLAQFANGDTARALVQNGSDWYVSATELIANGSFSLNGYTETWYSYDPSANQFLDTSSLGIGVSGSELTDIQAFGVLMQAMNFDGTAIHAANFQLPEIGANMVQSAPPSSVAIDFGGDYNDDNQASNTELLTIGLGDYDFGANALDDYAARREITDSFVTINNVNGLMNKTTVFFGGAQYVNFDNSVTAPVVLQSNYKWRGLSDALQIVFDGNATTDSGLAFAPYVKKADFLNGFNFGAETLCFEDAAGSVAFAVSGDASMGRALVQNGSDWYVSATTVASGSFSVNGCSETWHAYDPSSNLFMDEGSLGAGVAGSTLTDIQAAGVLLQRMNFDATGNPVFRFTSMILKVTQTETPTVDYQVTDDFNRIDTAWSSDSSLIRSDWASSGTNVWRINGNRLEVDVPDQADETAILYNTSKQTVSGGGSGFTLSIDVTATTNDQWCGIVLNYQNPSNYYMLRIKTGTTSYQFIPVVDGVNGDDLELNADALVTWVEGTAYTFTVSSYTPYEFNFEITEAGSSTVLNPVTSVSFAISLHNGGYAGFWATDGNIVGLETVPNVVFDNFNLTVSVPESAQTFEGWMGEYNVGGQTAMTDDFDGDGMNNLTEYALGGDPSVYDAGVVLPLSVADTGNGLFVYVYDRRLDASTRGLTYRVEVDSNLLANTWTTNGVTEVGAETLDAEFEAVTNTVPLDQAEKFLRLQIEVAE